MLNTFKVNSCGRSINLRRFNNELYVLMCEGVNVLTYKSQGLMGPWGTDSTINLRLHRKGKYLNTPTLSYIRTLTT